MTVQCQSGDAFTDFDGSSGFFECYDAATFNWGPDGDDFVYFCDRHLLAAMMDEVNDNAPEDMFTGEMKILNMCGAPACKKDIVFHHETVDLDTFGKVWNRYCDEHSLALAPYWDTIEYVDVKDLPVVLNG